MWGKMLGLRRGISSGNGAEGRRGAGSQGSTWALSAEKSFSLNLSTPMTKRKTFLAQGQGFDFCCTSVGDISYILPATSHPMCCGSLPMAGTYISTTISLNTLSWLPLEGKYFLAACKALTTSQLFLLKTIWTKDMGKCLWTSHAVGSPAH